MRSERGFTLVELITASAILLVVCGGVLGMLHQALAATPVLEETTDVHQRARVLSEALAADGRLAAAGTASGPLSRLLAAVEVRRSSDPVGAAFDDVLTLRYAVPRGARARLAQPLEPTAMTAAIELGGCPAATVACGFTSGSRAMILDAAGGVAAFVAVIDIGPGSLAIENVAGARPATFAAGAEVVEATEVTYSFDPASRQVRRAEGDGTFVVADNVVGVTFACFDEGLLPMPLALFSDGPFVGLGPLAFDQDLRRVSAMRATLRIETGVDRMRGADPRFFARPGTARGPFTIPDVLAVVDVALRNVT